MAICCVAVWCKWYTYKVPPANFSGQIQPEAFSIFYAPLGDYWMVIGYQFGRRRSSETRSRKGITRSIVIYHYILCNKSSPS